MRVDPLFAILVCTLPTVATHGAWAGSDPLAYVKTKTAPLRAEPKKSGLQILTLYRYDVLDVHASESGYYHVTSHFALRHHKEVDGFVPQWAVQIFSPSTKPVVQQHHNPQPQLPIVTSSLMPAEQYVGSVNFTDTRAREWKVEGSYGFIHFKNAAVADNRFSSDISIDRTFLYTGLKPATLDFTITLFDAEGNVVHREAASINSVSSRGGEYVLVGQYLSGDSAPVACSIKYSAAWVPKS